MQARRKRFILISTGLLALAAAGVLVADWPLVATQYRLFRLDAARTWGEAMPHIDALLARAGNPRSSALVAASLGTRREALTYWVLQTIAGSARQGHKSMYLASLAPALPWILSLGERLERDDELLRVWAHFIRWRELEKVLLVDMPLEKAASDFQNTVPGFLITVLAGPVFETTPPSLAALVRDDPLAAEAWLRLVDLLRLGRACALGAPLEGVTEIETPVLEGNARDGWRRVRTALSRVIAWRKANRPGETALPRPADPLPGWRGSVLEAPVRL
jgi:hypothetical protein